MFVTTRPPKYWRCAPGGCENGFTSWPSGICACPCSMPFGLVVSALVASDVSGCVAQPTTPTVAAAANVKRVTNGEPMDTLLEAPAKQMAMDPKVGSTWSALAITLAHLIDQFRSETISRPLKGSLSCANGRTRYLWRLPNDQAI